MDVYKCSLCLFAVLTRPCSTTGNHSPWLRSTLRTLTAIRQAMALSVVVMLNTAVLRRVNYLLLLTAPRLRPELLTADQYQWPNTASIVNRILSPVAKVVSTTQILVSIAQRTRRKICRGVTRRSRLARAAVSRVLKALQQCQQKSRSNTFESSSQ